ncbi:hypothetical protein B0H19DRAFT_1275865 [Mycena capillaripes]|nr:hypothetical protein B0H19DRAFT_1275865 [Mycena capillaripes]
MNDPTRSLEHKAAQWASLHHASLSLIQATVFENKKLDEETPHLGVFLKLVAKSPNYDHRSFIIDKVALIPFARGEMGWSTQLMTGYCLLPNGKSPPPYWWHPISCTYRASGTTLPPGFDLHRYITHINRGITHFHGSYWPLPRRLSNAAFEAAEPPKQWLHYMRLHHTGFQATDRYDVALEVPVYDYNHPYYDELFSRVEFDSLLEAMTKVDTTEFKKLLDDPGRELCVIPRQELSKKKGKSKGKQNKDSQKGNLKTVVEAAAAAATEEEEEEEDNVPKKRKSGGTEDKASKKRKLQQEDVEDDRMKE